VPSPATGRRLLLVGEDAELATLVALAAARLGVEIVSVATGRAALQAIARRAPSVAVLDLPLADVRGSDVLAALARARVPSLAVSGVYRGPRAAEEVRRLGACDFFEKPFAVEALAAAVGRALGVAAPGLVFAAIESAPRPALEDGPVAGGPAGREGLAAPLPEARRPRQAVEAGPPPSRGDLAHTTVPRLLVAVHQGQATGALTVARGAVKKILVFEAGAPVYAASNVGAERFAAICVRRGVVAQERLDALRREAAPGARTADVLAAAGLLPAARRAELLGGQVRAIAWSVFEWREGAYAFQLCRPPAVRTPLRLSMSDLLLEGILRTATLPRLRAELPREIHLAPAPDPAFELYALGLRPKEAHLLSLADGTKSVADLVRLSEMEERDALAFLQACRVMRVLDEVERVLASTRRIGFM
jgi:CheY-like chemotaxis protein